MESESACEGGAPVAGSKTLTCNSAFCDCTDCGSVATNSTDRDCPGFNWPAESVVVGNCAIKEGVPVRVTAALWTSWLPLFTTSTRTRICSPPSKRRLPFSSSTVALNRKLDADDDALGTATGATKAGPAAVVAAVAAVALRDPATFPPKAWRASSETLVANSIAVS